MRASARATSYHDEASGYGSRALGAPRPDSALDLLVTVPDAWLATHSRLEASESLHYTG